MPLLVKGDSTVGLAFAPPPTGNAPDKYWRGVEILTNDGDTKNCDLVLKVRRPYRLQDPGDRNQPITAQASVADGIIQTGFYLKFDAGLHVAKRRVEAALAFFQENDNLLARLQQEFMVGIGFPSLIRGAGDDSGIAAARGNLTVVEPASSQQHTVRTAEVQLPNVLQQLWTNCDDTYRDRIVSKIGTSTAARFRQYLKVPRLPYLGIVGSAGSGKTHLVALVIMLYLHNAQYQYVYCAAPTHVATSKLAQRLSKLAAEVDTSIPPNQRTGRLPTIIRGYNIDTEADSFIATVRGKTAEKDPYGNRMWSVEQSVCEHMLKVARVGEYKLGPRDSIALENVSKRLETEPEHKALRDWIRDPASQCPCDAVRDFALAVLNCANVVCTTPFQATDAEYGRWNRRHAKATVLDEAGAMLMADAVCVWLNDGRPLSFAGDEKQAPTVLNFGSVRLGKVANPFAYLAKISVLEHAKKTH